MVLAAFMIALYEFFGLAYGAKRYRILHLLLGGVYLSVAFGSFIFLRFGLAEGLWLVLAMMVSVWASDTGAYFTGKTIGGAKLAPYLSPNKTWAGLGGAMFFCGLMLALVQYLRKFITFETGLAPEFDTLTIPFMLMTGFLLGAVGQVGDLLISFYKRRAHAKDSGSLIPGHGGLLDRIDSLLLVSPVFLGILLLCR